MYKLAVIVLALVASAHAKGVAMRGVSYDNCNGTYPVTLEYLSISPDPLKIPGTATFDVSIKADVDITSPLPGYFLVTYHNETTGNWDTIQCVGERQIPVGSCNYTDACVILSTLFNGTSCPSAFVESKVPCNCPILTGSYDLVGGQIDIPSAITIFPDGVYNFKVQLFDSTGKQILCINISGEIVHV